ncbi:50S ribosomal protein L30 [Candidatus Schneideria nysicola]|uniref:50S ribosomal protein L30 n=1 Tax=Candidatus Schneideria nysicola TaxID=1081631 RepID=UPI001CAA4EC0|nr:50S ribosomal protein L30 [Candidatus Schneideria nysicola]UAJ64936.1 50S ribosomal protein L30 [Candidatus Schneideria nysicola]UAJ65470.1 50S ribosomal protein L30 [Candidatus Schneideria nysicola]UAJ65999.1 50S ribosomal protein L30 [Candidatus Schneideria nysicola]
MTIKNIKITQIRSTIGCLPKHKAAIRALGLRHIGHTVKRSDVDSVRGNIDLVNYMLKVEKE